MLSATALAGAFRVSEPAHTRMERAPETSGAELQDLAFGCFFFELQGGVLDGVPVTKEVLERHPQGVAIGMGHSDHVRRQSDEAWGDRPHMKLVNAHDSLDAAQVFAQSIDVEPGGRNLE